MPDEAELSDLSGRDWLGIFKRAARSAMAHNVPMLAQALAYSAFMAIPAVLLVVVGVFTLTAGPSTIDTLIAHVGRVIPAQATQLLSQSLHQLDARPRSSVAITIVGFVLALWTMTSAMTTYMTGLNMAYGLQDKRNFVRKRAVALAMVVAIGCGFLLVAGLLIFGPVVERWLGRALHIQSALGWIWWIAQWPILIGGLLAAFATLLYLGPDSKPGRWQYVTPGSLVAVLIWLLASAAFAFYTANFGSYNKTWGSLAAVIVMLVWLWLGALALLFGGEVNAEAERDVARSASPG